MTARPGPGTPGAVVYATHHRRGLAAFMAAGSAADPLVTRSGIVNAPGNPLRVGQNSPLGMSVVVQPGTAEIHRTGRGPYLVYNDAAVTLAIDPAPATNSRYDLVYIAQADNEVDGELNTATTLGILKGTVAPSPARPYDQLPAGGLVLAEVGPIISTTTTITDSLIATAVAPSAAVRGAPIPVRSQAEREALSSIASASYPITVERLDTGTLERNAGSGWRRYADGFSVQAGSSVVTLDAAGQAVIVFPTAFVSGTPVVLPAIGDVNGTLVRSVTVAAWSATQFTVQAWLASGAAAGSTVIRVNWLARGAL